MPHPSHLSELLIEQRPCLAEAHQQSAYDACVKFLDVDRFVEKPSPSSVAAMLDEEESRARYDSGANVACAAGAGDANVARAAGAGDSIRERIARIVF